MSLLDSGSDPYEDEDEPVLRTHTGEPLFGDTSHKGGKAKRSDRRSRGGEDKRGGANKPIHWSKQKENVVLEKTPKKVKGQGSAKPSVPKSPPDSPKSSRPSEGKGTKGGVVQSGLLPSPNVKSQRKRYSQLSAGSSSSGDELAQNEGSLFSNKPALRREGSGTVASNPFLDDRPFVSGVTYAPVLPPPMLPTGPAQLSDVQQQELAWVPTKHHSLDNTSNPMFMSDHSSPVRQPGHAPPVATNPMLAIGDAGGVVGSPPRESGLTFQDMMQTNPFITANQFSILGPTFVAPPPPPTAPPPTHSPTPTSPTSTSPVPADDKPPSAAASVAAPTPPVAEDWSISDDLHSKCVQQFNSLEPVQGVLLGDKAREFFIQSKLPNQELSAIWRLSDVDQDNALSQEEFCIAMKLVLMRRKGLEIPAVLPQKLMARKELERVRPAPPISTASSPALFPVPAAAHLVDMHSKQSAPELKPDPPPPTEPRGPSPGYNLSQDEILVDIGDETTPLSPEPRVGQIIALDDSPLGGSPVEDLTAYDQEDSSVLVKVSSGSDSDGKPVRPVRPAPPKPRPQKLPSHHASKHRKSPPGVGVASSVSPPPVISPQVDTVPILKGNGGGVKPAKPPRPSAFVPVHSAPKKSAYSTLLTSPPAVEDNTKGEGGGGGGFGWRQLATDPSPSDESKEKGHARSTSLDLNKMLLGEGGGGDVFGGMPSAVPPKPPPKQKTSSPPPSSLLGGVNEEEEEEEWAILTSMDQPRPRALSTGSMASTGGGATSGQEEHYSMDASTAALLLVHQKAPPPKAPKPRKVPILPPTSKPTKPVKSGGVVKPSDGPEEVSANRGAPKRPQPPGKHNKLAELYRGSDGEVNQKVWGATDVGVVKDKGELQVSIRSLKENNEALIDINRNLEQKLFKLMEDRVRLARELNLLSGQS